MSSTEEEASFSMKFSFVVSQIKLLYWNSVSFLTSRNKHTNEKKEKKKSLKHTLASTGDYIYF